MTTQTLHVPRHRVRVLTAASLFDGHDAAINVMRRVLQAQGCEVVHLGHDRSVAEVVQAAVQEDVAAVAISSYQGGHVEYFGYLVDALRERGVGHVRVYGGGGGVIVPAEIELLARRGVRIYSPQDGARLGLAGMINEIVRECDEAPDADVKLDLDAVCAGDDHALARAITRLELGRADADWVAELRAHVPGRRVPVLGVTGTGGAGKSSLTDELIRRVRLDDGDALRVVVVAIDPTRRRGGGALLGDRIRMNALAPMGEAGAAAPGSSRIFFRSLATRGASTELPDHLDDVLLACRAGADLVIVETPGIGQGDAAIADLADVSLYVMTSEFGAAGQLEKIQMLEVADAVAVNKVERYASGNGEDARRDVARQLVRNREAFGSDWRDMPVFATSAARYADDGVTALYHHLRNLLTAKGLAPSRGLLPTVPGRASTRLTAPVPPRRVRYLSEVADAVRAHHERTAELAAAARRRQHLTTALAEVSALGEPAQDAAGTLGALVEEAGAALDPQTREELDAWPGTLERYRGPELAYGVRGREIRSPLRRETLSGTSVPRVVLPRTSDHGDLVTFLRSENVPGAYPFTAGVFPLERDAEPPTRMFAGEGDPARTNRRFHLLSAGGAATRLSTAFDSVTLYGRDPDVRPDIYGKVGTSGVSVATLDDIKDLYAGFDLCSPTTSVSMTINGPAPTLLAMFFAAAIDARLETERAATGHEPSEARVAELRAEVLRTVRGTVQADILKEDQGQNTCIFSTEFSLRCMGDMQEFFVANGIRNFYSVSVSGYHIAEAGANPISQLAFTLANAFTYVEAYLARGMAIDDFAPNMSFFFSNGMDAEYTVIGRVARRIWAIAMKERYGASERSQKLKYHIQTSGRSLHAQEMDFNDIRTTLQALCAIYDRANSLHTNAFDEAVTTPTPSSVRRALAIQMIINQEWGLAGTENPLQGSYVVTELTDLVEQAVLAEFDRLTERGGVLGAMETGYQRGRIQDESLLYEQRKHDGSLPIVGVNTFLDPDGAADAAATAGPRDLARATEEEKASQVRRLADFHARHADAAPAALARLQQVASSGGNVFAELMETVRVASLGQITQAFFEVGGQYRRSV